jgi:hypothetical protein
MAQEPSGFEAAANNAMNLPGADALLAAANQIDDLQPYPKRHMAALKNTAHAHGKRLAASIALIQARAGSFAVHFADTFRALAMKAYRTMRPKMRFDIRERGVFIVKVRGGKDRFRHGLLLQANHTFRRQVCQV